MPLGRAVLRWADEPLGKGRDPGPPSRVPRVAGLAGFALLPLACARLVWGRPWESTLCGEKPAQKSFDFLEMSGKEKSYTAT